MDGKRIRIDVYGDVDERGENRFDKNTNGTAREVNHTSGETNIVKRISVEIYHIFSLTLYFLVAFHSFYLTVAIFLSNRFLRFTLVTEISNATKTNSAKF